MDKISIHVPAWGTTNCRQWTDHWKSDFNPRSRVGNDDVAFAQSCLETDFNPRSRVGNDGTSECLIELIFISIHVPAWGTTAHISV